MAIREYIGARYVPRFMGTYDNTQVYEALDVVDNGLGTSYIAKIPVPAGTPLTNTTYWAIYGATSGAIINLQNQIDAINADIGDLGDLKTTDKDSIVGAINEAVTGFNKVILISDSYGNYGSPLLLDEVASYMGLSNTDYVAVNEGSSGFAHAGVNGHVFLDLLQSVENNFDPDDVSHIIVLGGANDTLETDSDVTNAVNAFYNYAIGQFPTCKVIVGMISNTTDATKVRRFGEMANLYNDVVSYWGRGEYIKNSEYVLKSAALMNVDGIHPNNYGTHAIAAYVGKALRGIPINVNRFKTIQKVQSGVTHNIYMSLIDDTFSVWSSNEKAYPLDSAISITTGDNIDLFDIKSDSYCVGSYYQDCACPCTLIATPSNTPIAGNMCLYNGKLQFRALQKGIALTGVTELQIPEYNIRFNSKFA